MNEVLNDPHSINIVANGEDYEVAFGTLLPDFLQHQNLSVDRVVVERNGHALSPSEALHVVLQEGDVLEIVRIVAGG